MSIRYLSGLSVDSTVLVVDAANDRVGIGTASPGYKLEVSGTVWATDYFIQNSAGTGGTFRLDGYQDYLYFYGDSAAIAGYRFGSDTAGIKMQIGTDGNVGIGTTSPVVKTHIVGPTLTTTSETTYPLWLSDTGDTTKALILGFDLANDVGVIQAVDQAVAWKSVSLAPSGGNVGIGTTAPGAKLDVLGLATIRNSSGGGGVNIGTNSGRTEYQYITFGGGNGGVDYGWQIGRSPQTGGVINDGFYIYDIKTNNTPFAIALGGNVGIGTTSPAYKLDVNGVGNFSNGFSGPSSETGYRLKFYDNGGTHNDAGIGLDGSAVGGEIMWFNALGGFYFGLGTGGTKVTISNTGNVGIGTTSPNYKLDVNGSINIYSGNSLRWGSGDVEILNSGYSMLFSTYTGSALTEKMRITSAGNVGIGTTSPEQPLVVSNGGAAGFEWVPSTGRWYRYNRSTLAYGGIYTEASEHTWSIGASEAMRLNASGNVGIGTTNPDVFSRGYSGKILGISSSGQSAIQLNAATGNAAYFDMGVNGTRYLGFYTDTTSSDISTIGAYPLTLSINSVPRLTIASTGAATFSSSVTATSLIKVGGTSSQYLMADGSVSTLTNPVTGTGTTNYVTKWTSGSAIGDSIIYDNGTNVGIGTTSPYAGTGVRSITVNASSYPTFALKVGDTFVGGVFGYSDHVDLYAEGYLNFETGGSEKMRVTAGGNVGIGTTAPSTKLEVGNFLDAVTNKITVAARYEYEPEFNFRLGQSGTNYDWIGAVISSGDDGNYNGKILFKTANVGRDTPTTKMVIKANGNVGIGTTAPDAKLVIVTGSADDSGNSFSFTGYGSKEYVSISKLGFIRSRASDLNGANMHFLDNGGTNRMEMAVNATSMTWYSHALGSTFMVFQHTTGNVGINQTSPQQKLDVFGNISLGSWTKPGSTYVGLRRADDGSFGGGGDSGLVIESYNHAAPYNGDYSQRVHLRTHLYNGGSHNVLTAYGTNVGIGTTAPTYKLEVSGTSYFSGLAHFGQTATSGSAFRWGSYGTAVSADTMLCMNQLWNGSGWTILNSGVGTTYLNLGGEVASPTIQFGTGPANTAATTKMIILNNGDVGIGTTSPATKLDVNGGINIANGNNLTWGGTYAAGIPTIAGYNAGTGGALYFYPNGSTSGEKMRLNASGNLSIGNTNDTYKLDVSGTGRFTSLLQVNGPSGEARTDLHGINLYNANNDYRISFDSQSGTRGFIRYNVDIAGSTFHGHIFSAGDYNGSVTDLMLVRADGNVGIGTTSPAAKLSLGANDFMMVSVGSGGKAGILFHETGTATATDVQYGAKIFYDETLDVLQLSTRENNVDKLGIAIDRATGNVGIGTTAPSYKLDVNGGSDTTVARFYNSSNIATVVYIGDSGNTDYSDLVLQTNSGTGEIFKAGTGYTSYGGALALNIYNSNGAIAFHPNNTVNAMFIATNSNVGIGTTSPAYKLDVGGVANASGGIVANGENFEKYLGVKSFADAVANRAINVQFGDFALGGRFEITITGTFSNANAGGGITKVFSVLTNPGNNIYTNESRVTTAIGPIVSNFAIGEFQWDSGSSQYIIPISHIVASGNPVYVHIKVFGIGNTANVYNNVSLSDPYTLTALSRNYEYYNNNVGIGTTSPAAKLDVNGSIQAGSGSTFGTGSNGASIYMSSASSLGLSGNLGGYSRNLIKTDGTSVIEIGDTGTSIITAINISAGDATGVIALKTGGNNTRLYVNSSGNVGIGTTNPLNLLHVSQASANTIFRLGNNASYDQFIYFNGGNDWSLGMDYSNSNAFVLSNSSSIGTNDRVVVTTAGNVGIGTTAPSAYLDVKGLADTAGVISLQLRSGNTSANFNSNQITLGYANTADYRHAIKSRHNSGAGAGNAIDFYIWNNSLNASDIATNPIMSIDTTNVGIGTTVPTEKLHVDGSTLITYNNSFQSTNSVNNKAILARVSPTSGIVNYAEYATATNLNGFVIGSDDARVKGNIATDSLEFITNTSTRMTILSGGNVGINTTVPGSTLHVVGDVLIQTGALGVGVNPNATDGRIDASNDIVAFSTSDKRLKENITPIANALEKVRSLTGVEFDWKEDTKSVHGYEGHDVGVIAQDVQAVLPEAVRTNDSGYLSVRYEKMIALLVEAMKEQQAQIDELKKLIK